jgi:hypothetical protein
MRAGRVSLPPVAHYAANRDAVKGIAIDLGLQLIGRNLDEGTLFLLGSAIEKTADFPDKACEVVVNTPARGELDSNLGRLPGGRLRCSFATYWRSSWP